MEGIGIILVFAVVVIAIVVEVTNRKKRTQAWAAFADRMGLAKYSPFDLAGELDSSDVRVDIFSRGSGKNKRYYTRFRASGDLPHGLALGKEGFFSRLSEDIQTGDAGFDHAVRVTGDETLALALLDSKMRGEVQDLVRAGGKFEAGCWTLQVPKRLADANQLERFLRLVTHAAAETRAASRSIPERLRDHVIGDPNAAIRRRCLEHLIHRYPNSKALAEALDEARDDEDAWIRLIAASALGYVERLLELALDRRLDPVHRADALTSACAHATPDAMAPTLEQLISDNEGIEQPAPLARALIAVLLQFSHPRAEATLIALTGSQTSEVQLDAIRALGKVGTIEAVPALVPLRDRMFAFARASAASAKEAILAIQARSGGAEAGALSLAEADGGLALADEPD